ncbi:MAG: tetratricopeptide repeat protein [Saprospiraceae bacterium]|nr:tetratricopeptide repeat protein [Saprospiraceae bacterium]MCB9326617.1 tetratricopeptide repeat protein [Lewinellaceae bacterium]
MNAKNGNNGDGIDALVIKYESSSKSGQTLFFDENSFLQLIEFYEREERLDKAIEVANQAIERYLFSVDFYLRKAELLIDAGKEKAALKTLDRAEAFAPGQLEITLLKAEALTYLDRGGEALEMLEDVKLLSNKNTFGEIYLMESLVHEFNHDYELMFQVLKSAIKLDPENDEALERLWLAVELSRKYKESISLHKEIINEHPYSYMAWYNLGHAYAYLGNYEEAIEAYEFSFVINENFEYAIRDCADLCFETNQFRKAIKYYMELLDDAEADSDLFQKIGESYQQLGNGAKAVEYFRQALKLDPLNDEVYYHMGECFALQGHWKEAARFYKKAVEIEDGREEYFGGLALAKAELGALEEAEDHFRKAVEIAPDETRFWMEYASFLVRFDRTEDALSLLTVAEITADSALLQFGQVACLFSLGRRKEASLLLWQVMEEGGEDYTVIFDMVPELEYDEEIQTILSSYLP